MSGVYTVQLDYLLRLFIAAVCGLSIGFERESRMKDAGIRTHFIVAVGAALIMIISKYGFRDQIGWSNLALDPSRIAAQVVSGVGFIGAGIIFMKEQSIVGLTTAAGIWTTAGIGLSIGSGLYFVGLAATIFIIFGQILLHRQFKWLASTKTSVLILQIIGKTNAVQELEKIFKDQDITILKLKGKSTKEPIALIDLEIKIKVDEQFDIVRLISVLQNNSFVRSVKF
jgi:putative Mg2+ transporter-C (MgtC) family protein